MKLTTTLAAVLLAGSVGVAFAQSGTYGTTTKSGTAASTMTKPGTTATNTTAKDKLTGCKTTASKEEKGSKGSVANSSSHNAATTGSNVMGKRQTGC